MSDAAPSKYKPKRYHRRSTWACDECKLRKKKCDGNGTKACSKCTLYGKDCTYESKTRPSQPPTQRIRDLEDNIRGVRELLGRIKPDLQGGSKDEVERMLEELRPAVDESTQSPITPLPGATPGTDEPLLRSMLIGRGRLLQSGSATFFHGPYSGAALICSMLEFFDNTKPEAIHPAIMELFDRNDQPHMAHFDLADGAHLLQQDESMMLLDIVLAQTHPFLDFLDPSASRQIFEAMYITEPSHVNAGARALCQAVYALGRLMYDTSHQDGGCDASISQSSKHFFAARYLLGAKSVDDLVSLQAILCMIVYLISTSQLSTAYTFISIASTSAIKQGLHVTAEVITNSSKSVKSIQKQLLTALVNIDLFVTTVLGLPPLVNIDTAGTTLVGGKEALLVSQVASQPFFGEKIGRQTLQSTQSDVSSQYRHIVSLTASVLWDLSASSSIQDEEASFTAGVDATILRQGERDLADWTSSVGIAVSPSSSDEQSPGSVSIARQELELAYYWSQLLVHSPFLHYLRPLAEGQALPESLSRPALTCLKIAVNTIVRCENLLGSLDASNIYVWVIHPSNWTLIYTLFLSVVVLIFLISIHEGTSKPSEAWRKAETGIRILVALRCKEGGADRCLTIIKELVRQLNYTVDFDIRNIENTTMRVCERQRKPYRRISGQSRSQTNEQEAMIGPTSTNKGSTLANGDSSTIMSIHPLTADEMLARASGISLLEGDHDQYMTYPS